MTAEASKHLKLETEFLSRVEANLEGAKGRLLRGSTWRRSTHDESDRLRAVMARSGLFDRDLLKSLPTNRRVALHGFERRLLFWKRRTGVAIASTIAPLKHYVESQGETAPPVDLGELADHVRKLVGDAQIPHVLGVCSLSGFTDTARNAGLELPNVTLVLIEPDGRGGWRVTPTAGQTDDRVMKLFDPEAQDDKIERVGEHVRQRSADLLTGGLAASTIAAELDLPEHLVRRAFERASAADPELRVSRQDGECTLFRGALVDSGEKKRMNVFERMRQLFAREGNEAEKINALAERRAALARRRDRMYEDIGQLEQKEASLLEAGKAATSQVPRRRIAAQMAQLRKDIARQNTAAAMLNQQINIISTNIHNLTLIQQGELARLPDSQELTENAVKAEELLESLKADSEMVSGLEVDMQDAITSSEELAILKEFETAEPAAESARKSPTAARTASPTASEPASGAPSTTESPRRKERSPADPEAT
jgi:hypothetical protein